MTKSILNPLITGSLEMVAWAALAAPPFLAHLSHTLYNVGGQVQVQVHGEHNAVVVFDGEEPHVVRKSLVEDLVLQYDSMSTAVEEGGPGGV